MQVADYGTVTYEGIEYRLTQHAYVDAAFPGYLDHDRGMQTVYRATGVSPDGAAVDVTWYVRAGLDRYAPDYVGDAEMPDDESEMCDWDAPASVTVVG